MKTMRIGIGYDIHRLIEKKKLILGGVEIPHKKGLKAHTDGDVLIHAIIDAMIGAAALGDIGHYFPDNTSKWKDASSLDLLEVVHIALKNKGYKVVNIDSTIIAEEPRLSKYIGSMKRLLAQVLEIKDTQVNVKSKTNDGLDAIGEKDAISAWAVVLLEG